MHKDVHAGTHINPHAHAHTTAYACVCLLCSFFPHRFAVALTAYEEGSGGPQVSHADVVAPRFPGLHVSDLQCVGQPVLREGRLQLLVSPHPSPAASQTNQGLRDPSVYSTGHLGWR